MPRKAAILAILLALHAAQPPRSCAARRAGDDSQATHLLTRAEVLAAIERTLAASQLQAAHPLTVNDLDSFANVVVVSSTPVLRVTQIQFEDARRAFRVLLWVPDEPKTPPFWVRVKAQLQAAPAAVAPAAAQPAVDPEPPHILVNAGDRSTLVIEGHGIRILTTAIALERGSLGQPVRVRTLATGRIITARVSGERTLSANVAEASQ